MEDAQRARILLVEDEENLRHTLRLNFELSGYHVTTASTGPEGYTKWKGGRFDAVVMDVMLPEVDGHSVVERMRVEGDKTPVMFLTARNAPEDRIRGLRSGEDHVAKPFELQEVLLRLEKLVRSGATTDQGTVPDVVHFGGNTVELEKYVATGFNGKKHALSNREVLLLRLLIAKAGEVVSREEILQKVWGYDVYPTTRTVDNFIVSFRKYFESEPRDPQHFISVRGVGYKFLN